VTQGHRRIDAGTRREAGAPDRGVSLCVSSRASWIRFGS
jgi:hypothetical protein